MKSLTSKLIRVFSDEIDEHQLVGFSESKIFIWDLYSGQIVQSFEFDALKQEGPAFPDYIPKIHLSDYDPTTNKLVFASYRKVITLDLNSKNNCSCSRKFLWESPPCIVYG